VGHLNPGRGLKSRRLWRLEHVAQTGKIIR
jgi:hypothetical protein